jgi:hypothetical protein
MSSNEPELRLIVLNDRCLAITKALDPFGKDLGQDMQWDVNTAAAAHFIAATRACMRGMDLDGDHRELVAMAASAAIETVDQILTGKQAGVTDA